MRLATALDAAIEAGHYFRDRVDSVKHVKTKSSQNDLVTEVDPACERIIRTYIERRFPDDAFLGEESTAPGSAASVQATSAVSDRSALWIVDPLDGTTNFVYSIPLSVVSIAFATGGQIQIGVVFDPYRDEVFYGVRGQGAFSATADAVREWAVDPSLDWPGQRLLASRAMDIAGAVLASGFPTRSRSFEQTTAATVSLFRSVKSIRALGAAALSLAYVAAGRLDAYFEFDLNAWDLGAGVLLIEEAGGQVTEIGGAGYSLAVRDVVAAGTAELAARVGAALRG